MQRQEQKRDVKQTGKKVDEFGQFIDGYRDLQDKHLWISGESSDFFARYKAEKLAEWFSHLVDKQITILDFGAGDGVMTHYVKKFFPKAMVLGADVSQSSINAAQKAYPELAFKTITDAKLPYDSDSIDLIFSAGVFHHIPFDEHQAWMREVVRIAKPSASFVMFEINPLNPVAHYIFKHHPVDKDATMLTPWFARKLLTSFGKVGTKFYCFFPKAFKAFRWLEKYMTWIPFGAHHAHILNDLKKK